MKENELMIGDWVQVPSLIDNVEHYDAWCKVKQVRDCDLDVIGFKELKYNEIIPIPLTAEILEKIGFWYEQNVGYVMEEDEYEIIYDLWDHKLRILKNREQILNLEYWGEMCVHELQHALRLCNIDKEIEIC